MSTKDEVALRFRQRVMPANEWAGWPKEVFLEGWLEERIDEDWTVCFRLAVQNDRAVISEMRVIPSENRWTDDLDEYYEPGEWKAADEGPKAPVPAGGVRSVHLRAIHLSSLNAVAQIADWVSQHQPRSLPSLQQVGLSPAVARRKPGPVAPSDRELAEVAREYVKKVSQGIRDPHRRVAVERGLLAETVRDKIKEARKRELLTSPGVGRAGGRLTAKALKVLAKRARSS